MEFQIIRHVDDTERICIPRDMRRFFHLTAKSRIIVEATADGILLRIQPPHSFAAPKR